MGLDFSHGDASFSYSGFTDFREKVANLCGLEGNLRKNYENGNYKKLADHPIFPLINHSDSDGELTVEELKTVAPALEEAVNQMKGFYKGEGSYLVSAMKAAIAENEPLLFR